MIIREPCDLRGASYQLRHYFDDKWNDAPKETATNLIVTLYDEHDVMLEEIVGTPKRDNDGKVL